MTLLFSLIPAVSTVNVRRISTVSTIAVRYSVTLVHVRLVISLSVYPVSAARKRLESRARLPRDLSSLARIRAISS